MTQTGEIAQNSELMLPQLTDMLAVLENRQDTTARAAILKALPEDLLQDLKGHLIYTDINNRRFQGESYEPTEENDKAVLAGELFERLVGFDQRITGEQVSVSAELLSLVENPQRYDLAKEFGPIQNPDLAYATVSKKGVVVIYGVGECKLGRLGNSALTQLEHFTSSLRTLERVVNKLHEADELEIHGLHELSERASELGEEDKVLLKLSGSGVKKILIVPRDRSEDLDELVINDRELKKRFIRMAGEIEIKHSAFSRKDVDALAELFYAQIKETF